MGRKISHIRIIYITDQKIQHVLAKAFWSGNIKTSWAKKKKKTKKIKKIYRELRVIKRIIPSLHTSQNVFISPNHVLPIHTERIFTTSANPNFANSLPLSKFILIFISKNYFFYFVSSGKHQSSVTSHQSGTSHQYTFRICVNFDFVFLS